MNRDHTWQILSILLLLVILLPACAQPTSLPATPSPTPRPLHWDERASVTLLRTDSLIRPLSEADALARVPDCVIYGNGRAQWVISPGTAEAAQGAQGRVYESQINRESLNQWLNPIAESGLFTLDPVYGPDLGPVRELYIRMEGMGEHTIQVADIEPAPLTFDTYYGICQGLAIENVPIPDNAVEVMPTAGWIHAFPAAAPAAVHLPWSLLSFPLDMVVEAPRWIVDSDLVAQIWTAQRDYGPNVTFDHNGTPYRVIVRYEGITVDTPRAPRVIEEPPPLETLWFPSPEEIIFKARFSGGLPNPYAYVGSNAVDACTIYGDGRIVISEQPQGVIQAGQISETQMESFLIGWINNGYFDTPTSAAQISPTLQSADAILQTVTLNLMQQPPTTRTFTVASGYLSEARNACTTITTFTPIPYPETGFMWAELVGTRSDFSIDLIHWPPHLQTLNSMTAPAEYHQAEATALDIEAFQFAWRHLHAPQNPPALFYEGDNVYAIYISVPGLTDPGAPLYVVVTPIPPAAD